MPLPIIPLIAGAVAGIGQSLLGSRTAKYNTDATNRANRELAEYAYSKDLEMWERNNAYNSPMAQMQRLKEAGLNPNLVYGNGAVANTGGQIPRYSAPRVGYDYKPAVDLPSVLNQYQDFQLRQAQIDNLKAQRDNINARTVSEASRSVLLGVQGKTAEWDLDRREYLRPYEAAITANRARASEAEVQSAWQKLTLMRQDEILKGLESDYKRRSMTAVDLDNEKRRADLIYAQYRNEWIKMGITTSDNVLLRVIARMVHQSGLDLQSIFKGASVPGPYGKTK